MSWPQWPAAAATGTWPGPVAQTGAPVATPGAPYTPEQWAALQQQNWQQWVQWQQQYQQWQAQYGEQYQKSMSALTGQTPQLPIVPVQPPLPAVDPKTVPPPLPDTKPPLPPEEPPSTLTSHSQPPPPVSFNTSVPPPSFLQGKTPTLPGNFQQQHDNNATQPPKGQFNSNLPPSLLSLNVTKPAYAESNYRSDKPEFGKRAADFGDNFDDVKKNRWESNDNFSSGRSNLDQNKSWNSSLSGGLKSQWPVGQKSRTLEIPDKPPTQRPNVEELSEAEKNFDKQFEQWEAQFNKWKDQNAGHPDKQQYKEYEAKWESWRAQLLERREQMRRKRLGIVGPPASNSSKSIEPSVNTQQNMFNSSPVKSLQEPSVQKIEEDKAEIKTMDVDSSLGSLFSQPPKEQRTNIRQRRGSTKSDTDCTPIIDTGFLTSTSSSGGIPGLDLVKDDGEILSENKEEEKKPDHEIKGSDLEAISKGINSILGDEKLLNMLSMVSQNKKPLEGMNFANSETNIPESQSPVNRNDPNNVAQDEYSNSYQSNDSFGNQSNFNNEYNQGQEAYNESYYNDPYEKSSWHDDTATDDCGDFNRGYPSQQGGINNFRGPPGLNQFNRCPPGPNNFNQEPSIRGFDNFNQGSSGNNIYNQGPLNRGPSGPNNFNQGPMSRGPPGLNGFNQGPPNRGPPDANNFNNQGPLHRGPPGLNNFNHGSMNRGPNDFNNRGPNNYNLQVSANRGPPNRDPAGANNSDQGLCNRGPNEFNQGPQNRGPKNFNQGPPNRGPPGPNNFNQGALNRGLPGSNNFNQGAQNRGPNFNNQGPPNRGPTGPNIFGAGPQNSATNNFNRRPNQGFESDRPGNFNQDIVQEGSEEFNGPPSERGPGDFMSRGPANRNAWIPDDFEQNQRLPNRDSWPPNDRRGPADFDNQDYPQQGLKDVDQISQHSGATGVSDTAPLRGPRGPPMRGPPDGINEPKVEDSMLRGVGDKHQEDFGRRPLDGGFSRWRRDQTVPFEGRQFPDLSRYPDRFSHPGRDSFPRSATDKYWDEALILKPATVVDYGHKSLHKPDVFIEPVQTFDYGHTSKNVDPTLRDKELQREPPYIKFNKYSDPNYNKKQELHPSPPRISSFSRTRSYDEEPSRPPMHDRKLFDTRRSFDGPSNHRYENELRTERFEKYEKYDDRRPSRNFPASKSFNDRYDKYEEKPMARDRERSSEREMKIEQFVNKPNPSDNKIEEKVSIVTVIEDLLSPPGRNVRPPRIVIILRGPPGSGKTFLAKLIKDKEVEQGGSAPRILSLDDYFMIEQDKEVIEKETGRKTVVKEMVYEYEECMEISYRQSLEKAFKKTITDGFFPFIILDCINDKTKHYSEMWSYAKQNGFQVYVCQMELDIASCTKRNVHHRSEIEIERLVAGWEQTPSHYLSLDATSLIQAGCISEVEMEEVPELDETENDSVDEGQFHVSKWERMEHSGEKLARLDGISKPLRPRTTMEDYLQLDDASELPEARPGQKRVRWADLEERRRQEKIRAIGFVVGQTDWDRMMDPTQGGSALTQTKYIERVRRF